MYHTSHIPISPILIIFIIIETQKKIVKKHVYLQMLQPNGSEVTNNLLQKFSSTLSVALAGIIPIIGFKQLAGIRIHR